MLSEEEAVDVDIYVMGSVANQDAVYFQSLVFVKCCDSRGSGEKETSPTRSPYQAQLLKHPELLFVCGAKQLQHHDQPNF